MKLDSKLAQMSAAEVGIGYFVPKKNMRTGSPWAAELEEIKCHPQLFQILANFEQEHGLPSFMEGSMEQILQARMYRYVIVSQGWGNAVSPDELTHTATWIALAAA